MASWKTEDDLWGFLVKRLRGKWYRSEMSCPDGFPDSFGLWHGQVIFLEHKIGRPSTVSFSHAQLHFAHDCERHSVPWWCCFGHRGRVRFFSSPRLDHETEPPFWIPPEEVLHGIAIRRASP